MVVPGAYFNNQRSLDYLLSIRFQPLDDPRVIDFDPEDLGGDYNHSKKSEGSGDDVIKKICEECILERSGVM